ncbi:MAG: TonB family protein [Psychromonas sp.]|nr:TonB family protein [Psychromonas sp.]
MSNFSRYLPYIIITLVIYVSFFYAKEDLTTIDQHALSKKNIVQLSTFKQNQKKTSTDNSQQPHQSKHIDPPIEANKKTKSRNKRLTKKVKQTPTANKRPETKNADKSDGNANTTLIKSHRTALVIEKPLKITPTSKNNINKPLDFTQTKAIDAATLKGYMLDRSIYLDLDLPKRAVTDKNKIRINSDVREQSETKITTNKGSQGSLAVKVLNTHQKEKRLFKPSSQETTPKISTKNNPKNLQEAISIKRKMPKKPSQGINQQGLVVIKFFVTSKGKTQNPSIMVSSGYNELDRAVISFVLNERFMPALKNGEKISSEQIYSHLFKTNNNQKK